MQKSRKACFKISTLGSQILADFYLINISLDSTAGLKRYYMICSNYIPALQALDLKT